ncbi:DUF6893 family small protein [Mycolicibacterium confluentis]|uniref:Uncharacterized protein n=1 Tax=Mycolicibacterium confluentis TaxID=28047 RepID=A0A7I7Y0G8_9MYCO|nr:hypothetical protein MCNF_31270 [Mycolicibacterium confluentis]
MEVLGWAAAIVVVLALSVGVVVGVRSIPDVRRYLKMRQM